MGTAYSNRSVEARNYCGDQGPTNHAPFIALTFNMWNDGIALLTIRSE